MKEFYKMESLDIDFNPKAPESAESVEAEAVETVEQFSRMVIGDIQSEQPKLAKKRDNKKHHNKR